MALDEAQIERYARHIVLEEIGGVGQGRLLDAKVLVVGAGGLGSPLLMYLAAAGVGTIGVVDDDAVSLSNLQRQIAHTTDRVGMAKTDSARRTVADLNPDVTLVPHPVRLTVDNALELVGGYDIVADGSDNFATRFLVNDACFFARTPLVAAAILRFDAQISTYKAHLGDDHPCYRCIFRAPPPAGLIPSCARRRRARRAGRRHRLVSGDRGGQGGAGDRRRPVRLAGHLRCPGNDLSQGRGQARPELPALRDAAGNP